MSFAKAGLLVGPGSPTQADLNLIEQAGIEAVKLRAKVNPATDLPAYRAAGANNFMVQLLSPEPAAQPTSAASFLDFFDDAISAFVKNGVTDFEIHGEPNAVQRGLNVSWASAGAFSDWFIQVADLLHARFGPLVRLGFPGLAPPVPLPPEITPGVGDSAFLAGCRDALAAADFLCCHVYWETQSQMRDYEGALRFLRTYVEQTDLPVVISEFANVSQAPPADKGNQYAEFIFFCSQYTQISAAYAFTLRSPEPAYAHLVWQGTSIPSQVGQRKRMPHSSLLRMEWPTVTINYTQAYGKRQAVYRQASQWLHGGHEGVDLQAASRTTIRACLAGSVTRGTHEAYGNYVRVASQVEGVGQLTLLYAHLDEVHAVGQVSQGDVIGLAGETGNTDGPHLHLGFKITNLNLFPTSHYLNAQPYLDPVRGTPRAKYDRTYVLLPPGAGGAWAEAVVEASWDDHRFTVGGSADDAGIGDLDSRRVLAVNPQAWGDDLDGFFQEHYPGVVYVPVEAATPVALTAALNTLPPSPAAPPQPAPPRGLPREQYDRTYVLLPPAADSAWAKAVVGATWDARRFTVGGSADDAGIGDLDTRHVVAVNPSQWVDDLKGFFKKHYPGIVYVPVEAATPQALADRLNALYS